MTKSARLIAGISLCVRSFAYAALLVLAAGCARRGPHAASRPSVVALVGDRPIEFTPFAAYLKSQAGEELKDISPQVASSLLDQYFDEILLEEAVEETRPPLTGSAAEKRRALINARARLETIGNDELRREYESESGRTQIPETVRISQLLVVSRERADAALARLREGSAWLDVSREFSVAPNAQSGGALGLLARSDLPREFEKAIWKLPAGGMTAPLPATNGFHVFRVEERLAGRSISFEESLPALRLALSQRRSEAAAAEIVAEARKKHPVFVVEEHLPFPYVGKSARFVR